MALIQTLIRDYLSISNQLAYYVGKKNISQIDKYERDLHERVIKLVVALCNFHGLTADEIENEMSNQERNVL